MVKKVTKAEFEALKELHKSALTERKPKERQRKLTAYQRMFHALMDKYGEPHNKAISEKTGIIGDW